MFLIMKNARRLTTMSDALMQAATKEGVLKVDHRGVIHSSGIVGAVLQKSMKRESLHGTVAFGDTARLSDFASGERGWQRMIHS